MATPLGSPIEATPDRSRAARPTSRPEFVGPFGAGATRGQPASSSAARRGARAPIRRWFASRALDALAKSLVCFALLHQVLLAIHVARHGDLGALNVFTMLEAQRIWPGLGHGPGVQLWSIAFALGVYGLVYAGLTRPRARAVRQGRDEESRSLAPLGKGGTLRWSVRGAPAAVARFRPTAASGLAVFAAGLIVHNAGLMLVERFTSSFPSVPDVLLARLPYVAFGLPGELCFVAFLVVVATLLFRSQPATVPVVLTRLGLFYACRGVFLFFLPIGSPVGAPALESRFVLYPWADHAYFPGGHAGLMTILSLAVEDPRRRRWLLAATAVFAFGTLLARTHYTADVLAGALLGYAITAWSRRRVGVRGLGSAPARAPRVARPPTGGVREPREAVPEIAAVTRRR